MLPNYTGKHSEKALFEPIDYIRYQTEINKINLSTVPKRIVMLYSEAFFNKVQKKYGLKILDIFGGKLLIIENNIGIFAGFGIGAPAATVCLEGLIAAGTNEIICLGFAGALQKGVSYGDIILCNRAIRDEGVSHHYLASNIDATPDPKMLTDIRDYLRTRGVKFKIGPTWTIDAPYRETIQEIVEYQKKGIITVEMEAAALFSVARVRGAKLSSIFVISDSLADLTWSPKFHDKKVEENLWVALNSAIGTLEKIR